MSDTLTETRALLDNGTIRSLHIVSYHSDRDIVQIADESGDIVGELDYRNPDNANLIIDAPAMLHRLADECAALHARVTRLEKDLPDTEIDGIPNYAVWGIQAARMSVRPVTNRQDVFDRVREMFWPGDMANRAAKWLEDHIERYDDVLRMAIERSGGGE